MQQQPIKSFKETYSKERRIQMFEDGKAKNKGSVVVIVERDSKCKALPDLRHCRFSIAGDQKMLDVCNAIRKRIVAIDSKLESQPVFLFANNLLPKKQMEIKDLYTGSKDPEDGLLYLKYSNMDPY